MSLGEVLDRTFTLYKSRFWLFAGIVAIPYLVISIFSLASRSLMLPPAPQPGTTPTPQQLGAALATTFEGILLYSLVFLCAYAAAQAATVAAVSDLYLGHAAGIRQSYARVRGKILTVVIVLLLTGILVAGGMILFIIPGIILLCRTALAVPAATLEDITVAEAISRSMKLTKGSAMGIFLVFVLFAVLSLIAILIFQLPFLAGSGALIQPHMQSMWLEVLSTLSGWVANILVAPIATVAFALIYYNQRIQKEAFDLQQLMAAVDSSREQTPGTDSPSPA